MDVWVTRAAMLATCALVGIGTAVATVIIAGDKLLDVDDRIDSAVAKETAAAVSASQAKEREGTDQVAKALAAFATDMDRRVIELESRSYRLTDFLCGALDSQTVVTGVELVPIGLGQQQLDLTTATICVEEE